MTAAALTRVVFALAAEQLDAHATLAHPLTGAPTDRCMTDGYRGLAIDTALGQILDRIRDRRVRQDLRDSVHAMLPPVAGTVAGYANTLRTLSA